MPKPFKLPDLGEGIHEGEILAIAVSVGDDVKEGDTILEVETDKAAVEIPSPFSGKVEAIHVNVGDTVIVGQVLMTFKNGEGGQFAMKTPATTPKAIREEKQAAMPETAAGPVPASPATRRLARELGVDLRSVSPTGPAGLVTAEDVRAYSRGAPPEPEKEAEEQAAEKPEMHRMKRPLGVPAPALPDFSRWGPIERIPVRSLRKATARQMALAWSMIPHVNNQDDVDVTRLEAFRQKHKGEVEAEGGKLTFTVFALKAVATALKANPNFNATLDPESEEIILKKYYHIGVATKTDDGLIVPVIRDVDRKSIVELAVELQKLLQKTRERKATIEDLQGGTFTITNVGPMGGGHFTPIINYPQVAILGMGAARRQPVIRENDEDKFEVVPRLIMPVVLCIDHRVLDGADAIPFLNGIKNALEDPDELLMTMT
ncbi:MAG: 2-oxo acid dehydrogenase subunit E2 [Deltaproteobacteria bacterium]|nr:2-oxo acid dehydrogenase subunit E2 [Deltaproteobacteria bacterium]